MRRELFQRICDDLAQRYKYFRQTEDGAGKSGCTTRQKVTAAIWMLASGCSAVEVDSAVRMGETTIYDTVKKFARAIIKTYKSRYLRPPNEAETARLLQHSADHGFPGMLGSIDCMHWAWDKCPTGWQGFYKGHCKRPTVILEAIATHDLWISHAFFGLPGALNDIQVVQRSPVFDGIATNTTPAVNFIVNGHHYDKGYYLADGMYPSWATLVQGVPAPLDDKQKFFTKKQAEYRNMWSVLLEFYKLGMRL